jgi:hypothetical protein
MTRKEARIKIWLLAAQCYAEMSGWDVKVLLPTQIRLKGRNMSVDLFPVSGKVNVVGTNKYFKIEENIEDYLHKLSL